MELLYLYVVGEISVVGNLVADVI